MLINAITWANVRLRGGWKSYATTAGGYAALLALVFAYISRMGALGTGGLLTFSTILLGIQMVILVFLGCTAIGNAVRRDIAAGLIASHRLMPISPASAVLGYILGPAAMALALTAVTLVTGGLAAGAGGLDLNRWAVANLSLALFVAFLWVGVTFMAFISKNAFGGLFSILFASVSGGGFILMFVPALAVVFSPVLMTLNSLILRGGASVRFTAGYGFAVAAQVAFGAIFFRGAMRRYRRDDVPALGTLLSLLLLGAWVITSAVGVLRWDDFIPGRVGPRGPARPLDIGMQSMTAVVSSILMALTVVSTSAKAMTEWLRNTLTTGHAERRPVPPPVIALLATVVIIPLAIALRPQQWPELTHATSAASISFAIRVAVGAAAYLLSISYLLRIIFRVSNKPLLLMLLWTVLTWLVPIGIDAARAAYAPPGTPEQPALFARMSLIGELDQLWKDPRKLVLFGLAVQVGLTAIPAAFFYATEPRMKAPPAPEPRGSSGSAAGQFAN